jgi:hypothetical protein
MATKERKTSQKKIDWNARYDAKTAKHYSLKFNKLTDPEILLRLESVGPVQTYIKRLIAEDIERQYKVYWIGGDRDGELVGIFEDEWDAQKFAKAFHEEHQDEFDPTWGGVGITGPKGEDVEW